MSNAPDGMERLQSILLGSLDKSPGVIKEIRQSLTPDGRLLDAGIDSLDLMDFLLRVEDEFRVEIEQDEYPKLVSLRAILTYLSAREQVSEPAGDLGTTTQRTS